MLISSVTGTFNGKTSITEWIGTECVFMWIVCAITHDIMDTFLNVISGISFWKCPVD